MDVFREFCETTTWHGWAHLIECKRKWGQIAWLIVIILGLIGFLAQMIPMVRSFANIGEHYSSSVQNVYDFEGLPYPTITICNYNRIRKEKAEEYGFNKELIKYFLSRVGGTRHLIHDFNVGHIKDDYTKWRKKHKMGYTDVLETMSHDCPGTLINIRDSGVKFTAAKDPCKSTMEKNRMSITNVITHEHGHCHQVNISNDLNIDGTGNLFSIKLLLNAQTFSYIDETVNNANDEGIAIQLTFNGDIELGDWLSIMPGMHTRIALETTRHHTKSISPESKVLGLSPPCFTNPSLPVGFDKDFSVTNCFQECVTAKAAKFCNCVPIVPGKTMKACELEELESCIVPYMNKTAISGQLKKDMDECKREYCRYTACDFSELQTSTETIRFPTRNQLAELQRQLVARGWAKNTTTHDIIERNFAMVDIYYKTMAVQMVELFESVTLSQLIGNLGGILGLFMGVSYLTIVHLIVTCCCCGCEGKKKVGDGKNDTSHKESAF